MCRQASRVGCSSRRAIWLLRLGKSGVGVWPARGMRGSGMLGGLVLLLVDEDEGIRAFVMFVYVEF